MQDVNTLLHQLKRNGFRLTAIRTAMVTFFAESEKPLTYFDLQKLLAREKISANKTTIYRELAFLKQQKIITELDFGSGSKHYEIMPDTHHHHIVCTNCEMINHVELEGDLESEEKKIAKQNNFKILAHSLEFYGLCQNCQASVK